MAQVTVTIDGKAYRMACEEGQEDHLTGLAALWAAAALTLVTGWDYLRVGLRHMD